MDLRDFHGEATYESLAREGETSVLPWRPDGLVPLNGMQPLHKSYAWQRLGEQCWIACAAKALRCHICNHPLTMQHNRSLPTHSR
jgi:hypothetical protein